MEQLKDIFVLAVLLPVVLDDDEEFEVEFEDWLWLVISEHIEFDEDHTYPDRQAH